MIWSLRPSLRSLGLALGAGLCWGGSVGCAPPDVPPALRAMSVERPVSLDEPPSAQELPALRVPPSPGLSRYLARPVPDSVSVRLALEGLEDAMDEWRDASSAEVARRAAWRADRSLEALPTMEDWRPLIRAELLAKAGDTAAVRAALEEVDPATGFRERWGWRFLVQAHEEAEDLPGARAVAEEIAGRTEAPATAASAWFRAGDLALAADDTATALERLDRALSSGPESPSAQAAARTLDRISSFRDREQELAVGWALLAAGDWERAHRRLAPFVDGPEGSEMEEGRVRLGLGRALVELRRFPQAREMLAPLTGDAVPAELAGPALFWKGRAALGAGNRPVAEDTFLRLARRAPESPLAQRGLVLLLEGDAANDPGARTLELLDALFELGDPSAGGELAAIRLGTGKYLRGEYEQAATTFARYLERSPRSLTRQQASYWTALSRERRGNGEEARSLYRAAYDENPLSYYGVLAGERLDAPLLDEGTPIGPPPGSGIESELRNALIRLRVHRLVPTSGSFGLELERLSAHFLDRGEAAYDFADALIGGEFALHGIVLGREIHRREGSWNLRLLRIVHPFPYREMIVEEARSRGLDPFFVAGLIRQESMFDARVVSPAGAVGLMQLMPATARQVARSAGVRYSAEGLTDPRANVRMGTTFLISLVNRFDGRAEDALAAYNAGPTRLQRWRRTPEYGDRDVFMEHIPFRETRNYVKLVQQYARIYTALYGCEGFEPCLGLSYSEAVAQSSTAGGAPTTAAAAR